MSPTLGCDEDTPLLSNRSECLQQKSTFLVITQPIPEVVNSLCVESSVETTLTISEDSNRICSAVL
jgi:hypothetical protein